MREPELEVQSKVPALIKKKDWNAIALIDEIKLDEEVKDVEKEKVLNARKLAIGPAFQGFPPWNTSSSYP